MVNNGRIKEVTEDMGNRKTKQHNKGKNNIMNGYAYVDPDLPEAPRLEIYQETFGGLKNITEQWYKENRA